MKGKSWLKWSIVLAMGVAYAAISTIVSRLFVTTPTDMDGFFWPSAVVAAHGRPFFAYSLQGQALYPNANGPLTLLPLVPVVVLAEHLGWGGNLAAREALAHGLLSPFCLLFAWEGVRWIEAARGAILRPTWRLAAALPVLAAPPLWSGDIGYGHLELPIEGWLLLRGARMLLEDRPATAGILLGLALLARSTALLAVIPLAVFPYLLVRLRATTLFVAAAGLTAAAGLIPFLAADPSDVVHSLVSYRGDLPIGGGSVWGAAVNGPFQGLGETSDMRLLLALAVLVSVLLLVRGTGRQAEAGQWDRMLAALTAATCTFPLLAKTVWPYYFTDPLVLACLWWLGRPGSPLNRRMSIPIVIGIAYGLSEWGTTMKGLTSDRILEGAASSLLLVVGILGIWWWSRSMVSRTAEGGQRAVVAMGTEKV